MFFAYDKLDRNITPMKRYINLIDSGNDPSAGSPTETLLRLLLPLGVQVCASFRHTGTVVANHFRVQSEALTKTPNR